MSREQWGRVGAYRSWANTVDRTKRTAAARRTAPGDVEYWLARLPPQFADATEQQRLAAAEAARRAYFVELAAKSARARSKRKRDD